MGTTTKSSHVHLAAGSLSGLMSCILLQPLDLIKTRMQQQETGNSHRVSTVRPSLYSTARHVAQSNGLIGLWKGTLPTILRNVPGSGLYFYTLHYLRSFMATIKSPFDKSKQLIRSDLLHLSGGITARLAVGFVMMPITVVKVRFESNLYNYANISSALNTIVKKEGVRGLFSGFGATAMRDAPFAGIYIVFYERCKTYLNGSESITYTKDPSIPSPKQDYSLQIFTNMTAGLIGGFGATLCTQPFDLMKSRIQLDPSQYPNSFVALKKIIHDQGVKELFRGMLPRILRKSFSSAISWSVYEEIVAFVEHLKT